MRIKIVSNLGIKPLSGGIPLIDRIIRGIIMYMNLYELEAFCIWCCVMIDMCDMIMNIGIRRMEYIRKYVIVDKGLYIISMLVIHPICVMDE